MLLYFKVLMNRIALMNKSLLAILLLFSFTSMLSAQEEDLFGDTEGDSLLFGDEFDLGGDDFSFETDEEEAGDSEAGDEDDFFGDFDDEDTEEEVAESDTSEVDEWGLETETDYESLITRSADGSSLEDPPDHPLELGKYVEGTLLEDTGFTLSLYSPHVVPEELDTWFSFMDFSLTTELPWHLTFEPVELSFSVDISSFKFVNSFPSGGDFKGFSMMPIVRAEVYGFELETGLGMFMPTFGALVGLGYSYQYHSLFFSTGYRWNWAYDIEPIGSSWWLEPRFTAGIKFW